MASSPSDESAQFREPISPHDSNTPSAQPSVSTSNDSAKPSVTGILKKAVTAPPTEKLVNKEPDAEEAIKSIGRDGEKVV